MNCMYCGCSNTTLCLCKHIVCFLCLERYIVCPLCTPEIIYKMSDEMEVKENTPGNIFSRNKIIMMGAGLLPDYTPEFSHCDKPWTVSGGELLSANLSEKCLLPEVSLE